MLNEHHFEKEECVDLEESEYFVYVRGRAYQDEYDNNTWFYEFDEVNIFDSSDEPVNKDHHDFEDVMIEIYNKEWVLRY